MTAVVLGVVVLSDLRLLPRDCLASSFSFLSSFLPFFLSFAFVYFVLLYCITNLYSAVPAFSRMFLEGVMSTITSCGAASSLSIKKVC